MLGLGLGATAGLRLARGVSAVWYRFSLFLEWEIWFGGLACGVGSGAVPHLGEMMAAIFTLTHAEVGNSDARTSFCPGQQEICSVKCLVTASGLQGRCWKDF